eukprot:s3790_g25.t1
MTKQRQRDDKNDSTVVPSCGLAEDPRLESLSTHSAPAQLWCSSPVAEHLAEHLRADLRHNSEVSPRSSRPRTLI